MAVVNGYAEVEELDSYIASANGQATIGLGNRQPESEDALTAASRMIDKHCGQIFYDESASATARIYAAGTNCVLWPHAFHTLTTIATDTSGDGTFDETWTASDYQLEPLNGIASGVSGHPTDTVRAVGSLRFPVDVQARVEITARWGWAAVPPEIKRACMIQAHRLLRRPESPEGVAGFDQFGAVRITSMDLDVKTLLSPFVRIDKNFA